MGTANLLGGLLQGLSQSYLQQKYGVMQMDAKAEARQIDILGKLATSEDPETAAWAQDQIRAIVEKGLPKQQRGVLQQITAGLGKPQAATQQGSGGGLFSGADASNPAIMHFDESAVPPIFEFGNRSTGAGAPTLPRTQAGGPQSLPTDIAQAAAPIPPTPPLDQVAASMALPNLPAPPPPPSPDVAARPAVDPQAVLDSYIEHQTRGLSPHAAAIVRARIMKEAGPALMRSMLTPPPPLASLSPAGIIQVVVQDDQSPTKWSSVSIEEATGRETGRVRGVPPPTTGMEKPSPPPVPGRDIPYPPDVEAQRKRLANARPSAVAGQPGAMTDDALDMAADFYFQTGQMPSFGVGGTTIRTEIMNRAAARHPAAELAGNKAAYDANKSALTQLQKQTEAVGAFEKTALKNLDMFLDTSKGIVDSGSPWVNMPLRAVNRAGLGSKELSAFNAARQVALTEISRVVANPNLVGTLSDTARKEVEGLVPADATLAQIYAVAQVLRNDMSNRKQSLEEQTADLRKRINAVGTSGASGSSPAKAAPKVVIRPDGSVEVQ